MTPRAKDENGKVIDNGNQRTSTLFGKCVGAGVQELLVSGNIVRAKFAAMRAWTAEYDFEDTKTAKQKNSAAFVIPAIDSFYFHLRQLLDSGWEVAKFNGRPAVELSIRIDLGNGYKHRGFVDTVLWNSLRKTYLVLELKSTSWAQQDEATYGNSNQALGYSIALDSIAESMGVDVGNSYEVLYYVYYTQDFRWEPMPFTKSFLQRAEWIRDTIADMDQIEYYGQQDYFPKHGENCIRFNSRCQYYGLCTMSLKNLLGVKDIADIPVDTDDSKPFDFDFKIEDLIARQLRKLEQPQRKEG